MSMKHVNITMPEGLSKLAKETGVNISQVATEAVSNAIVKQIERKRKMEKLP